MPSSSFSGAMHTFIPFASLYRFYVQNIQRMEKGTKSTFATKRESKKGKGSVTCMSLYLSFSLQVLESFLCSTPNTPEKRSLTYFSPLFSFLDFSSCISVSIFLCFQFYLLFVVLMLWMCFQDDFLIPLSVDV